MALRCLICSSKLRGFFFPFNLFLWRKLPTLYSFQTEMMGQAYEIRACLCAKDREWAYKNPDAAETLLKSKVHLVNTREENE